MKLENIIINLREREPWEAVDLGTRLILALAKSIFIPWIVLISIAVSLSIYIQLSGYPALGFFIFWLFKPVYDSLLLYIVSNELFYENISGRNIIRNIRVWLVPGFKHSIYWWRLSPARSFVMPVHNLENLTGSSRRNRLSVLQKDTSAHALGLTVMALCYELLINLSLMALVLFMVPDEFSSALWNYIEGTGEEYSGLVLNTIYYGVTVFLIEPIYLGAGFMLYLNRRVRLEAWDIEIAFKKINNRLTTRVSHVP